MLTMYEISTNGQDAAANKRVRQSVTTSGSSTHNDHDEREYPDTEHKDCCGIQMNSDSVSRCGRKETMWLDPDYAATHKG